MTKQKRPQYFYVGQTVYSPYFGEGIVKSVKNGFTDLPILVDFIGEIGESYTFDGRSNPNGKVTLSQTPIPEIQNVPLPEMPDLKGGDVVLYWDNKKEHGGVGIFVKYVYGDEYPFKISDNPNDSGFIGFKYAEKYDPEKHYKQN